MVGKMANDDEAFFLQRGFGRNIGFGASPAVIVVDLVKAFTNPQMPLGAPLEDVINATTQITKTARSMGNPIFYTTVAYEDSDLRDAGLWISKMQGLATLRLGTEQVEVDERLGRQASEPLLVKKYASAFFGTDLITRLNSLRIDTLVITGCTTSGCVRSTAVDALQYGIRPIVERQAVGDRSPQAHQQSLFDLQAKYADVMELEDVLRAMKADK